jgi:hypothetical protein
MGDSDYSVVIFYSASAALRAEKLAKEAGLQVKLIPVPRHLSSDCGICLRFDSASAETVRSILEQSGVEFVKLRPLSGE